MLSRARRDQACRFVYTICYDQGSGDLGIRLGRWQRFAYRGEEVEEVFAGDHKVRRARQKRYIALGETFDGRLAIVVFHRLPGNLIRVITARDMDDSERRLFRRK